MEFTIDRLSHPCIWWCARIGLPLFLWTYIQVVFVFNYIMVFIPQSNVYGNWIFYLLFLFNILFTYSFGCAVLWDPGRIENVLKNNQNIGYNFINNLPTCTKCGNPKPERCHHCKTCGHCHVRMDHHCPILGQCVGLGNHQAFLVMLLWGFILPGYGVIIAFSLKSDSVLPMFKYLCMFVDGVLTAVVFGFYCSQMFQVIVLNKTTLEFIIEDNHNYSRGIMQNFKDMFGNPFWLFFPRKPFLKGFEWTDMQDLLQNNDFEAATPDSV